MLHAPPQLSHSPLLLPANYFCCEFPERALSAQKLHKAARASFPFLPIFQLPQDLSALLHVARTGERKQSGREPQLVKALAPKLARNTLNSSQFGFLFCALRTLNSSCCALCTLSSQLRDNAQPFLLITFIFPFQRTIKCLMPSGGTERGHRVGDWEQKQQLVTFFSGRQLSVKNA